MSDPTAIKSFCKMKIATISQLMKWLSCSIPTVRRRLKEWGVYTSYNHNGRYYTLPKTPDFDDHGLWRYQGVFFSKHGNLKQTVVYLISCSNGGFSSSELGKILGLQPRSFLSHFRANPELHREKISGQWVWFAANPKIGKQQKLIRLTQDEAKPHPMPSDMEAVMILVDLINHPNSALEAIAQRLRNKGLVVKVEAIRELLAHHGLLKKTVGFPSSTV